MKVTKKNPLAAGFSLVEMLVVIAVIGIIAAIAIPNIGKINDSAKDARARRNAQNIASVYASAQAAGYDFNDDAATADDVGALIDVIATGKTISDATSPFNGAFFGVKGVNTTTAKADGGAKDYLTWDADSAMLTYTGSK